MLGSKVKRADNKWLIPCAKLCVVMIKHLLNNQDWLNKFPLQWKCQRWHAVGAEEHLQKFCKFTGWNLFTSAVQWQTSPCLWCYYEGNEVLIFLKDVGWTVEPAEQQEAWKIWSPNLEKKQEPSEQGEGWDGGGPDMQLSPRRPNSLSRTVSQAWPLWP